jgi:alanine dehydrogenase
LPRRAALGTAGLPAAAAVTLGEILRGDRPAHQNTGQPTVYAPVGLPWQDLALTWLVYRVAVGAGGVPAVDLLS